MSQNFRPNIIGVDLFAGAGGMSLGAKLAGIKVACCIENDSEAARTYRYNHPEVQVYEKDIREWTSFPVTHPDETKVLFGGAPCQGFSTSNQRTRTAQNKNNWLFRELIRVAKAWQPDWLVFENVKGIAETEGGVFLNSMIEGITELGYTVEHAFLQAAEFGVPQRRTRLFIVGSKHGLRVKMPKPKQNSGPSVWEAISDLPPLCNGANIEQLAYASAPQNTYQRSMRKRLKKCYNHLVSKNQAYVLERYKHVPQGKNWESIPSELMVNYTDRTKCHTGIYLRLREDVPSTVIGNFRKNMLIHPRQDRGLSIREAARLQSFPDSYKFKGSIGFQQQQVGNAVPPLLAKAVFEAVITCHLSLKTSKRVPSRLPSPSSRQLSD